MNVFRDGAETGNIRFFSSGNGSASTAVKRTGNYSYLAGNNQDLSKVISPLTEFFFRVPFYVNLATQTRIFDWFNGGTELGSIRRNASTGRLEAYVGGTLTATGTLVTTNLTWYMLEVHVKIADASGDIEVKVDGSATLDIDYSGDTKPGAATQVDLLKLNGGSGSSFLTYYDDLGLNDTTGGVDDSWCGDGRIILLTTNGNGDVSQLMGSDGNQTDNYLLVDDVPDDSDTTYVEGSVVDERDLYALIACGLSGVDIIRVQAVAVAKDTVASGGKIALVVKTNTVEYAGSDQELLTSYAIIKGADYKLNPNTSAAWSISELDALQVGPKTR